MIHKRKISIQLMNHNETKIIHARTNSSLKAGASPIIHMIANSASSMNLKNSLFQPYEFWNKIGNIYWTSDIQDRQLSIMTMVSNVVLLSSMLNLLVSQTQWHLQQISDFLQSCLVWIMKIQCFKLKVYSKTGKIRFLWK